MATYEESGVNIELGDKCSRIAYQAAKNTFAGREGMIGEPVVDDGGFAGALDMGDHYLLLNSDGVGTKVIVAEQVGKFDTLGYDLLAMVIDDAVCTGAETISLTNTIDVNELHEDRIAAMMAGLESACLENKVAIAGGEIAELGTVMNNYSWNSTSLGIVEKDKLIKGDEIKEGDKIIGLKSHGFRSNGFSLIRHILGEKFGAEWFNERFNNDLTWGEVVLTPSKIYSNAILEMHGRYKEKHSVHLKGVVHVTGGGIPGNISRVLKKTGLGAKLHQLPVPHEAMIKLMEMGSVASEEAYKTWNMGVGMILVCNEFDKVQEIAAKYDIEAEIIGEVAAGGIDILYQL